MINRNVLKLTIFSRANENKWIQRTYRGFPFAENPDVLYRMIIKLSKVNSFNRYSIKGKFAFEGQSVQCVKKLLVMGLRGEPTLLDRWGKFVKKCVLQIVCNIKS